MAEEIFRDSQPTLAIGIPGALDVTASIWRDGVEVYRTTAPTGTFQVPWKVAGYDGPFEVAWEFFLPNDLTLHVRYEAYEVITPLVNLGTTPTTEDADNERAVRRIIETLCGQSFGFSFGAKGIHGEGGHILNLPQRIINVQGVSVDRYPYDSVPFGGVTITHGGWALAAMNTPRYLNWKQAPPEEAIITANGAIIAPGTITMWNKHQLYIITGAWGYEGIPTNISEAAKILIDDYTCDEDSYRSKFIANMRSADWRIEFDSRTWSGTGNVKADQLLSPYVKSGIGIV